MKQLWIFFVFLNLTGFAQIMQNNLVNKEIILKKDTIIIEKTSITPFHFKITDSLHTKIDSTRYKIDFVKGILIIKDTLLLNQKINIQYQKYPDFLTKTYRALDTNLIVSNTKSNFRLYHSKILKKDKKYNPFNGLETKGNILRGITFGNNQDGVLNSNLELQIQGNLSNNVKIRANIIDSNIPVQNNGYTQRLDEFDRIFIEIFSNKWKIIAGDLPFQNNDLKYLSFRKKVQGLSLNTTFGDSLKNKNVYVSGAVVRGKFTSISFTGQTGNQGPYNIINKENTYWLIVANSETVYVNGLKIKRGKDKDYTIDYNTAEIYFSPKFPINSSMRITVEYQISDQTYTRFASFNTFSFKSNKKQIQLSLYNENDLKNNPINQNLTQEQIEILANAGDNDLEMVIPSAVPEEYDPNKIQYKKEILNGEEIYVFSNNPQDQLYRVNFSYVGKNKGNYKVEEVLATGKVFGYIAPINNEKQGDFEPIITLKAPNKLQLVNIKTEFEPNQKIKIKSELSYSYFDKNLLSNIQDNDNNGFAGNIGINQIISNKKWQITTELYNEFISENFNTIQRIQNVEFNRDWNLTSIEKSQQNLFNIGLLIQKDSLYNLHYTYKNLDLQKVFKGNKHNFNFTRQHKKLSWLVQTSLLNTTSNTETTNFITTNNSVKYQLKNKWIGNDITFENNRRKDKTTNLLNPLSFKNISMKSYFGIGNKEKLFSEIGYIYRNNDSIQENKFSSFEKSNSIFVHSKIIQNKKTELSIYANYEINDSRIFQQSKFLNTQISFKKQGFGNILHFNTNYQTNSGNLPQQDFQYIEVEPGNGYYQWIDYNQDNIKDIDEFEIAAFQDQANYLRVALPTLKYIKINQNMFNASLSINFSSISKEKNLTKLLSHLSNQTRISSDVKRKRNSEFIHLNPFDYNQESVLALKSGFNNNLYFNRGKQYFSTMYSYLENQNKSVFITGFQKNTISQHKMEFIHLYKKQWLLNLQAIQGNNKSEYETFSQRNFTILKKQFVFNLDFLQSKILKLGMNYQIKDMKNQIGSQEQLLANQYGVKINFQKKEQTSIQADFNWINNQFTGNTLSAVGFQMLEGLQPGKNYTWQVLLLKKINSFLNLNINYQARKSENTKIIHVGSVQLRAVF